MAIYDFVGLKMGHFGPMFGPTTYWVSWRASFQGQVGGFVWQFTILLGLYWATSGLCSALQHIGSVGGLYVGLILAQVAILGHFKAMLYWAYPSFQGQVGGFVCQFTIETSWGFCLSISILLGLYWATSGLCSALQHIGSVGGLYE